jgi:energy-coupling factor transporter ATP-binding protein EcfA2
MEHWKPGVSGATPLIDSAQEARGEAAPIIALKRVDFSYERDAPAILHNIALSVRKGERILVLGPSGGGKSTLLMILAGLIPRIINGDLLGELHLNGVDTIAVDTSLAEFSAAVAIVMQDPESQITSLTVEDEVAFALENFQYPKAEVIALVAKTLRDTGMDAYRDHLVYTLSGGQKQRLAIACALARDPDVIILDEPLSNLDPAGAAEVMPLISAVAHRNNSTVIMTAHDFAGFADHFNRIVIVAKGRVMCDGPIREVLADVPYLRELGLEIPLYVEWAYERLGGEMESAPLDCGEAVAMVAAAGMLADGLKELELRAAAEAGAGGEPVIEVADLSVAFRKRTVLRDVSFKIGAGEIVALIGYNGSGKSTLALALAGAVTPAKGAISVMGQPVSARRSAPRTQIGYVFQYPEHQFLHDTALDEVMHDLDPSRADEARQILATIGIDNVERHPYELSGGEKRRLGVKSMTAPAPRILILDEPTYGQDCRNRLIIEEDIRRLNAAGTTIIVITHDMEFVFRVATRALVLNDGALVFDGPTRALFFEDTDLGALGLVTPITQTLYGAGMRHPAGKE